MRKYNDFEKTILLKLDKTIKEKEASAEILKILDFFIENILDNRGLFINNESKSMTLTYDKDKDQNASKEMINFFSLMDYLEKNGLIIKFKNDWLSSEPDKFLSKNLTNEGLDSVYPTKRTDGSNKNLPNYAITYPQGFYSKICSLMQFQIQLSPALEFLIQDNFETVQDKSFKQSKIQTYLSFLALGLSFLTLGFSWVLFMNSEKKEIVLSKTQINAITNPLKNIELKADSIEDRLKKNKQIISLPENQIKSIILPLEKILIEIKTFKPQNKK